jgi:hypothetical protein
MSWVRFLVALSDRLISLSNILFTLPFQVLVCYGRSLKHKDLRQSVRTLGLAPPPSSMPLVAVRPPPRPSNWKIPIQERAACTYMSGGACRSSF